MWVWADDHGHCDDVIGCGSGLMTIVTDTARLVTSFCSDCLNVNNGTVVVTILKI